VIFTTTPLRTKILRTKNGIATLVWW